jgi:hemoglobin/transferrin/lactoferrin receptor protein
MLLAALMLGHALTQSNTDKPQETQLDAVTVVGTKTARTQGSTPGTITVKTNAALQRELAQSIKDALRYEAGVSVQNQPSRFGLAGFNIRGLDANRVLIEIDGARVADSFSIGSFSNAGRDAVELDVLKRMEIVRGSASSLYGSAAMGGVVAFTTRDAADFLTAGEPIAALGRVGSSGADSGRFASSTLAFGSAEAGAFVSLSQRAFAPSDTFGTRAVAGVTRDVPNPGDSTRRALLAKFNGVFGGVHALALTLDASRSRTTTDVQSAVVQQNLGPSLINTTALIGADRGGRRRIALDYQWQTGFAVADALNVKLYRQTSDAEQRTAEARTSTSRGVVTPSERLRTFDFSQNLRGVDVRAEKSWTLDQGVFGGGTHRLTYGVSALQSDTDQLRNGSSRNLTTGIISTVVGPDAFPVRDFPRSQTRENSAYVQSELDFTTLGLAIIPGLRADQFRLTPFTDAIFNTDNPGITPTRLSESALSPKLGVLYELLPGLALHSQYATGFRAPPYSDVNIGFTNLQFGYTAIPNPNLTSESSRSIELGLRANGPAGFVDLVSYQNRYSDFIETFVLVGVDPQTGVSTFQSQNLGHVRIRGTELRAQGFLGEFFPSLEGFELRAAVAASHGDDLSNALPLGSIDPTKAVLGLSYVQPNWRVELIGTGVQRKGRVDDSNLSQFRPGSYSSFDLIAEYLISPRATLNVAAFNLGDRTYFDWSDVRGRPANDLGILRFSRPGRSVSAALNFTW